jgi:hypothetical protein
MIDGDGDELDPVDVRVVELPTEFALNPPFERLSLEVVCFTAPSASESTAMAMPITTTRETTADRIPSNCPESSGLNPARYNRRGCRLPSVRIPENRSISAESRCETTVSVGLDDRVRVLTHAASTRSLTTWSATSCARGGVSNAAC